MVQNKNKQNEQIEKAWKILRGDLTVRTWAGIGIKCDSRLAKSHPAMPAIRAELNKRQAVATNISPAVLANSSLSRAEKRAMGMKFSNASAALHARTVAKKSTSSSSSSHKLTDFFSPSCPPVLWRPSVSGWLREGCSLESRQWPQKHLKEEPKNAEWLWLMCTGVCLQINMSQMLRR
eukprot:TRINITY_DN31192_c0_g1_i1.p1 TRINITY_DN31192_c0_g1~~TRINITY_DN31192_c0_g1_i1.p1  ORF type:complete len:178 (-),score=18.96 TRINITY_DN31192_c0_g1_i1:121-654(-)